MIEFFKYFFCKLFNIVRERKFIVFSDYSYKEIHINNIYDIIYLKSEKKYYNVIKVASEIINDTMVYNWINVEEFLLTGKNYEQICRTNPK